MKIVTEAEVVLRPERDTYAPGETIELQYRVESEVDEIELSMRYRTEGVGDEDVGVAWLERRRDARGLISVALPSSPCSYDGTLIKIGWVVRIRGFRGDEPLEPHDHPFVLGTVARGKERPGAS